tara:strand:+ start:7313 stop:7597 length:285 start_codon:yes stop_codon:yes gene_type:complete
MSDFNLSPAEEKITALMVLGYTDKEIANMLFRSLRTVKFHVSNIFAKAEVKSRTELIAKFYLGAERFNSLRGGSDKKLAAMRLYGNCRSMLYCC